MLDTIYIGLWGTIYISHDVLEELACWIPYILGCGVLKNMQ